MNKPKVISIYKYKCTTGLSVLSNIFYTYTAFNCETKIVK